MNGTNSATLFKNLLESETVRSEGPAVELATDGSKRVQSHINKKQVSFIPP